MLTPPEDVKIFTVPGLWNSGPEHWQSYWEREIPQVERIQQKNWDTPVCKDWIAEVDRAVGDYPTATIVLVGHSLGCTTIAHWAKTYNRAIHGAMLVAPSDVEAPSYPPGTTGFTPMPLEKLPFPSTVIASTNDEYVTPDRARFFANAWGSKYLELEDAGHINSNSGLGRWEFGLQRLQELIQSK